MQSLSSYSGAFFDFDGLLVNTEHLHYAAYRLMLDQYQVDFPWDFLTFAGVAHKSSTGLEKLITQHAGALVQEKGWDTLYEEKKALYQQLLAEGSLELMPGAEEMLSRVKEASIPFCVVTNSTKKQVEAIKKQLPVLKMIPLWITRENYANAKPAPDGYLKAIEVLQVKGKMVGFEDSLRGLESLKQAGIDPILICEPNHPLVKDAIEQGFLHYPSFNHLLSSF